jgi:hypothetical protein
MTGRMKPTRQRKVAFLFLLAFGLTGLLGAFERFERPVRCRKGHLFTTIWVPFGSLKALRLGRKRFQYCPVGHHWTMVTLVDEASARRKDLAKAAKVRDLSLP